MTATYLIRRAKSALELFTSPARVLDACRGLRDIFLPNACAFCSSFEGVDDRSLLCADCEARIPEVKEPFCERCGRPFVDMGNAAPRLCGRCMTSPASYLDRTRFATYDVGEVNRAIRRLKYGGALYMTRPLTHILCRAFDLRLSAADYDMIVGAPMHVNRLRSRGFNQSVLLAQALAAHAGKPLARKLLLKIRDTPAQAGLHRSERLRNLKGAFAVRKGTPIRGLRILLVDDVLTTGATLEEAAKTLKKAGAARVEGLVLALRDAAGLRGPEMPLK
jgi:ComF family protein